MCVYIYIYAYIFIYVYIYIHTHTFIRNGVFLALTVSPLMHLVVSYVGLAFSMLACFFLLPAWLFLMLTWSPSMPT